MVSSTIVQQDSNTTQATDRTKRDALSFGAKQIATMPLARLIYLCFRRIIHPTRA